MDISPRNSNSTEKVIPVKGIPGPIRTEPIGFKWLPRLIPGSWGGVGRGNQTELFMEKSLGTLDPN